MSSTIIAILLLITFIGFIVYILKGGNLMIGFFIMAILWAVIGLVPFNVAIKKIFAEPALNYGPTIIYIVFGSWFGRVFVDSGIAPAISAATNKVGKKKPLLAAVLVALVTCLIFVSAYGVGSVIAIGVYPCCQSCCRSVYPVIWPSRYSFVDRAPMYLNVVLYNQMKAFFPKAVYGGKYLEFGIAAMIVQMVAVLIFLFVHRKQIDPAKADENLAIIGAADNADEVKSVPVISYLVPIIQLS